MSVTFWHIFNFINPIYILLVSLIGFTFYQMLLLATENSKIRKYLQSIKKSMKNIKPAPTAFYSNANINKSPYNILSQTIKRIEDYYYEERDMKNSTRDGLRYRSDRRFNEEKVLYFLIYDELKTIKQRCDTLKEYKQADRVDKIIDSGINTLNEMFKNEYLDMFSSNLFYIPKKDEYKISSPDGSFEIADGIMSLLFSMRDALENEINAIEKAIEAKKEQQKKMASEQFRNVIDDAINTTKIVSGAKVGKNIGE